MSADLCPWLLRANRGTYTIRGRARFPENATRPTIVEGDGPDYHVGTLAFRKAPGGVIAWTGDAFEARFDDVRDDDTSMASIGFTETMYDACNECCFRIDTSTWQAPAELEDKMHLSGSPAMLICRDGKPVAIEVDDSFDEDIEETEIRCAFRSVFAGHASLGELAITPGTRTDLMRPTYDARAEVVELSGRFASAC